MELKYSLHGLDCANCAKKVENAVLKLKEVEECNVVFATTTMYVTTMDATIENKIMQIVKEIEPEVEVQSLTKLHHDHVHDIDTCCTDHHNHEEHEECMCGHDHEHENHEHCGCNHDHDHAECGCSHDHEHMEDNHQELQGAWHFVLQGLDCANCAMKIEKQIQEVSFVSQAVVNFSTETLQVKINTEMSKEEVLKQLQEVINGVEKGVVLSFKETIRIIEKPKVFEIKKNIDLIIGIVFLIAGVIMEENPYALWIFLASYFLIGYKVLLKAFRNCLKLEVFDENFLMTIATVGAFFIGDYAEAVAVMLFYSIGEIFQSYAVNKTRTSISSLMDIKSEFANVMVDGQIQVKQPEEVNVGDILVVKVGEKIPLDGIVIDGTSTLDTSSLTGESLPRNVTIDQEVLAGVVNLTAVIKIKVTTPYTDSTVSKILELMENAASKKAPIEKFITRFARIYTPTVVVLAILLAIVPMFIFKDANFNDWLYRALTFLVVSCPCALVISIPLGLYAGLGKASKVGALVKGGNYLELLKDIDTIVFDKTGTLTQGTFEVLEINGDASLLEIGAYGEFLSNHPIARSIVKKYGNKIEQSRIRDFKEIAGKGIEVYVDDVHVYLGNQTYFESLGMEVKEPSTIGTIIHIGLDGKYAGNIVVGDTIKESTIRGIKKLKQEGIKNTVMLTGDHARIANDIASTVGIDTVYSQLLPQDKVAKVEELMEHGASLAFVGDGINDAPVLARAHVGIAMGGVGSDAAIEAADIVLMEDNIETIAKTIEVSRKTNVILKQNVIGSLTVKIIVLGLTMFGLANMWMGVFADVGLTVLAIMNAMRILK